MRSKYLDAPEVRGLRECLTEGEWLPLWLALETGLRIGDVVKLKRENLKPDGLHYRAQKTRKQGVAQVSAELRRRLPARGKWLFPSPYKKGEHITRQCAWARIKRAAKRAGLNPEGVSPHSLRKVFAVELYREKGFEAVKKALQHANALTTEVYSFADWNTGENANLPLTRRDLQLVVRMVLEALGEGVELKKESRTSKKKG